MWGSAGTYNEQELFALHLTRGISAEDGADDQQAYDRMAPIKIKR
jgi:hypothetical protein